MRNSAIVLLIFLLIVSPAVFGSQEKFDKEKLDDFLHRLDINKKAMFGMVISKDGKSVYENYIGFASVQDKLPITKLTKFRVGSITKIFTASIIFQLIEEGKIKLSSKLSGFFPKIVNSEKITISDLLSHRSGIHNITNDKDYPKYMTKMKTEKEMLAIITKCKPDFKPGEKFSYSNSNYLLLGYIIEKITGKPYREELKTRITEKIGLKNTYYGGKIDIRSNEARSYMFELGKWKEGPETDMSIPHGAGAIVSTPKDLTVFITSLFSGKLISKDSLNQMKDIRDGYGRGLMIFPFNERFAFGHDGGIDGFISNVAYFPNDKVAVSLISNGIHYNFNNILIGILSIYFNFQYTIPDLSAKKFKIKTTGLKKFEGKFTSKMLPLEITLKVKDEKLFAQATGQSAFQLTPFGETKFRFEVAGIIIKFSKDKNGKILYDSFILNQAGKDFLYKRK